MTLAEFWPQCLRRLHDILPAGQFAQWIAPLTVGEENGVWVVYGKNQFACNMLKSQFAAKIEVVRAELAPQQAGGSIMKWRKMRGRLRLNMLR